MRQAGSGGLSLHWQSTELEHLRTEMRDHHRRLLLAVIGSGLLIAGVVVLALGGRTGLAWAEPAAWLFGATGLAFLAAVWIRRRL